VSHSHASCQIRHIYQICLIVLASQRDVCCVLCATNYTYIITHCLIPASCCVFLRNFTSKTLAACPVYSGFNIKERGPCSPPPPIRWSCGPTRAMSFSFFIFLDHAQRRSTVGRTPLEGVISASQRPLRDNTQHSQQTNIHAPCGIRTHNLSRRMAVDLRLRPRGHWERHWAILECIISFAVLPSLTQILNCFESFMCPDGWK